MLKKYKNELASMIQDSGFHMTDFKVKDNREGDDDIFELVYNNSKFRFILRNHPSDYHLFDCSYTLYAPNFPMSGLIPSEEFGVFEIIKTYFSLWLVSIKEYLDELLEPDLWKNIIDNQRLINEENLFEGEEKQFSEEEKEPIRIAISELKLMIENKFKLDEEQKVIVEKRLDYLSMSLDRLNKIDWKGLALSTIVGISTALAFDTTKGNELLNMFKAVFTNIVNYLH